jgi:hypothetical protein
MGGTLANIRGYIESNGGNVIGASVLTGKQQSARIRPEDGLVEQLRRQYGEEFEQWWQSVFGFGFEFLTHAEAGYLLRKNQGSVAVGNSILEAMRS